MGEPRTSNPLVDQFRRGGIPIDLRLMAAQGALPLKPSDLVELLHFLLSDAEGTVKDAASASLVGLSVEEMVPIARDKETLPSVLGWILHHRQEREIREVVLQNTSLDDHAIESAAPTLPAELAELVVINQMRLLRSTSLLEAIESNGSLNNDQKRRLRELRETFRIGEVPAPEAPPPPPPPPAPEPPPEPEPEAEGPPPATDGEAVVRYLAEEERGQAEKVSAVQRLYRLNTAEKVIAALKGSREERAVLVRDPNRIVSTAVLGSPRLTEAEIESFAAMKNIAADILRQIGNNKDWSKRYTVISNLVRNPRTPLGVSLGFVARLNPRDMKSIALDRNVPEVVRKQAQRFVKSATERK
jgi:hypothetical protein